MTSDNKSSPKLIPVSDSALLIEFENRISADISNQVLGLKNVIEQADILGIEECVVGYCSLLIHYNCLDVSLTQIEQKLESLFDCVQSTALESKVWRVPVYYHGDGAIDLDEVARFHGLSTDEVIRLHKESDFRVFMVGFAPGWCYLGGLDPKLTTPRLDSPRLKVPRGCISIGGQQGMIGGQAMPSGWRLLGQTPVQTYNPKRKQPFFIEVGDRIQFYQIGETDYEQLQRAADKGEFIAQEVS